MPSTRTKRRRARRLQETRKEEAKKDAGNEARRKVLG